MWPAASLLGSKWMVAPKGHPLQLQPTASPVHLHGTKRLWRLAILCTSLALLGFFDPFIFY